MDLLKKRLAPISDAAWHEINAEAKSAFSLNLSARRIVDVKGPRGMNEAAVNLGRLEVPEPQEGEVRYGIRRALPLVELRARFELDVWELDNIDRGAKDPNLDDLRRAAREIAKFEERAVYTGFAAGGIRGLVESSSFSEPIGVDPTPGSLPEAVSRAALRLHYAGVEGPYALALGAAIYKWLDYGAESGYPLRKRIARQIEGPIVLAPYLTGGVLISMRGGDAELVLGQDMSIGYQAHDDAKVRLYFSESFTFRVITPEAVVALTAES